MWLLYLAFLELQISEYVCFTLYTFGPIWHVYCIWRFSAGIVIWYGHDIDVFAILFHSTAFDLNFLYNFIQKDDFWWSWQRYQFLCYINPCFCFLHQKSATNFVASQRYQDWGAGTWTSKSQLRNCGEGHGFSKKTCNGGVFVSMIETEDIKF